MNNSLLKDKDFCTSIEKLIDCHLLFLPSFASLQDWWEFLKLSIKEESIVFSRNKRRPLRKEQVFLTNKLIRLRRRLVDGDDTISALISNTESRLKALRVKEIEGIMIRSRAQWLEEGERPSRYFFNLQKIKAQRSHISSVYDLNGTEVSSQEEIETLTFIRGSFPRSRLTRLCRMIFYPRCCVNSPPIKRRLVKAR